MPLNINGLVAQIFSRSHIPIVIVLLTTLIAGCGLHNSTNQDSSKVPGKEHKFICDSFTTEKRSQITAADTSLRMTIKVDEPSSTATLNMAAGKESVEITNKIELLIVNEPPDLTQRQEDYVYMVEDGEINSLNYSLDIRINKKNGRIEFKPGPDSPTFKGKCVKLD